MGGRDSASAREGGGAEAPRLSAPALGHGPGPELRGGSRLTGGTSCLFRVSIPVGGVRVQNRRTPEGGERPVAGDPWPVASRGLPSGTAGREPLPAVSFHVASP